MNAITVGDYEIRPIKVAVGKLGEPVFSETVTLVEVTDEAGGEYVTVTQQSGCVDVKRQQISLDPCEWPALKAAIDMMLFQCRE
jgi:hypothetical protein